MPRISVIGPVIYLLIAILLVSSSPHASAAHVDGSDSPAPTAYELLESYGFPVGLLPKGVTGYDLDRKTGQFHAYLNGTCSFSLEGSYQLSYKSKISGIISKGKLTNLSGISVKVFFVWLNIVEVYLSSNGLGFSVGIASASFPIDNFYVSPQCGCGLDCNSLLPKPKAETLISSI